MNENVTQLINQMGAQARSAARQLAVTPADARRGAILALADALVTQTPAILAANDKDLAAGDGLSDALKDRLRLDADRLKGAAQGLREVADLQDPVGTIISEWERPNGLTISRVRTPLGVIAVIYEARPLVTVDAAALCLKAGNAVILRPGSDSLHTSKMLGEIMEQAFTKAGMPDGAAQVVPTANRDAVGCMLAGAEGTIDIVVPRGGKSLVARVQAEARIPVIGHLDGICHIYVDEAAQLDMASDIVVNAKMRRTGICGAAETLLIDRAIAATAVPKLGDALIAAGCTIKADTDAQTFDDRFEAATEGDWSTEYLGPIITIGLVDGVQGAIDHIATYGSGHTESIITDSAETATQFLSAVDSAIVMHNASTQFADGGEFGMGAEIGIATGRLHARGPVGAEQLTTFKYVVRGTGQTRP